jgi:F-type H+-transporting ATPase subunit b
LKLDLFTIIAQIVNFLILIALLRYFLFNRIRKAMDDREKKIESRLQEADTKKQEADREAESYRTRVKEFEEKREELLSLASKDAEAERVKLLENARADGESERRKWAESLEAQKELFLRELRSLSGEQVYAVARKALKDLADENLERQMITAFIARIGEAGVLKKDDSEEDKKPPGEIIISSSFEIEPIMRERLTATLREKYGGDRPIRFERSVDFIGGIEMKAGGSKISWSLDRYIDTLEERFRAMLEGEKVVKQGTEAQRNKGTK